MPVSQEGVQVGTTSLTWDEFNGVSPDQQKKLLAAAGVSDDQIQPLLDALQQTEIAQFKQYQQGTPSTGRKTNVIGEIGAILNPTNWFSSDPGHAAKVAQEQYGGTTGTGKSVQDLQKESGLADILNQVNTQSKVDTALGVTPGGQTASTAQPVFSQQNLADYVKNLLVPEEQAMYGSQGPIASEIGATEKSMQAVSQAAGQAGSPITQIMKGTVAGLLPLQQQYGKDALTAATVGPLVSLLNNAISAPAAIGAKEQSLGSNYLNLLQYYANDPTIRAAVNSSGGPGALGSSLGVQSLLSGLGAPAPQATGTGVTGTQPTGG